MRSGKRTLAGVGATVGVAGAISAALWRQARGRNRVQLNGLRDDSNQRPHILVAGAGFAGTRVIRHLEDVVASGLADVTLVDRQNYHLFTPLIYQVATGSVEPVNIAYPLRPFCQRRGVRLVTATIERINLQEQAVYTDEGRLTYDYLVIGLGSQTNYFGMRDVEERAHGLKTLRAASAIRREIITSIEAAADTGDPDERRRLLTFVVVGAGATGVELVGSIHDFVHNNLIPYYPTLSHSEVRIILIEATDTILPGLDEQVRQITRDRFQELGIDLRLQTAVSSVDEGAVHTRAGERIPANTIIWAAGVRPNPVTAGLPVEKSRDGRMVVDEYLRLVAHPNVFALGDNAYYVDPNTQKPLPPNASVAYQQGAATARNLARLLSGEPLQPFRYRNLGELIALGRGHAAAEIGPVVFGGLPAWTVWRGHYLLRLMGMKNRAGVAFDWFTTLLSQRYIVDIET